VREKRLFWISIIIVELVLVYIMWRPYWNHVRRPTHRVALAPPVVRVPETKPTPIVTAARKPSRITHPNVRAGEKPPVVNASLRVPEPVPAAPVSVLLRPSGQRESFWCSLAMIASDCDCKAKGDERANNLLQ